MSGIAVEARLGETESDRVDGQGGDANDDAMARNPRVARVPAAPTKAMILAQEVHHADYREWVRPLRSRQRSQSQAHDFR